MRKSFLQAIKTNPSDRPLDLPHPNGMSFGALQMKPFKVPTSITATRSRQVGGSRSSEKRPRVVFTENDFYETATDEAQDEQPKKKQKKAKGKENDDSDDDDSKKKQRGGFVDRYVAPPPPKLFPVYRPKTNTLENKFRLPGMKKKGVLLDVKPTYKVLGTRQPGEFIPRPAHDPLAEHAIVLWDPTIDDIEAQRELERIEREKLERDAEEDKRQSELEKERRKVHKSLAEILGIADREKRKGMVKKVAVVIDPIVGNKLRPHQVEGVKFLYRCTTGMTDENAFGCIMADEMGLGKTLQCITLMWTLLRQSSLPGKHAIDKAIVVCPSSLVRNWANELVKWLGEGAVIPLAVDGKVTGDALLRQVRQWCATKGKGVVTPVVIVSYEKLRTLTDELGETEVGLLLADEGHRLKNSENNTYTSLMQINCKRRVILTGTPIQNDLNEYFSLLNFCNPGYLGTKQQFHKEFEMPILKGRDGDASDKEKERGDQAQRDLLTKVNKFIIRRTNDLLSKYLPVKYEHVVFCSLSPFQLDLYKFFMTCPEMKALLRGKESQPLKAIGILRKMCNHPDLVNFKEDMPGAESVFPEGYDPKDRRAKIDPTLSGKLAVLDRFLHKIKTESNDKIVLISNFTQTLDIFEKLCHLRRYGSLRLDGTMTTTKRQKLVDRFNDPDGQEFIFLLSSKAGGCGINLIGANRLILFDPDWNPASDMQALARVWRDGQKKDCFVYRFVAAGTVEEKIFQRQSHKQNLSSCIVDEKTDIGRHFTGENMKELFAFVDRPCQTHDLFKCKRCSKDLKQHAKAPAMLYGDTTTWNHLSSDCLANIHDDLLRSETGLGSVTACFQSRKLTTLANTYRNTDIFTDIST
ncbi:DNA-dependent ATPase RAD54 [Sporobolomyces koalae]|uniref:DNA-dependent ATPase RAD54 n=1 Tax=Sporobolomyces koalae TaxID=500713 RepID=UPI00316BC8B8